MKKLVLACALLPTAGAVLAQSSVTAFGILDATVQRGTGSLTSKSQLVGPAESPIPA